MKAEAQLLNQVKYYLNAKGFCFLRINVGLITNPKGKFYRSTAPGAPDVVCCIRGRFIGIECKSDKGKQSLYQRAFQEWCERNEGQYWLIRDLDGLIEKINNLP